MKKGLTGILLAVALLGISDVAMAQTQKGGQTKITQGHPKLTFKKTSYNFGKVPFGSDVMASYEATNTGDAPIIVHKVIVPSGVTVHSYPVRPVFPGQSAYIQVKVDATKAGSVNKTISVDATDKGVPHKLTLKGQVKAKGAK